jgi:hypothetical protein
MLYFYIKSKIYLSETKYMISLRINEGLKYLILGPAAFRPKPSTGILYESLMEKGRPVLQGPLAASQLVNEVSIILSFWLSDREDSY